MRRCSGWHWWTCSTGCLGAGVVISGDLVISLSGVELVQIRLHALIASVRAEMIVYE